jgi:heme exporter protein CcmD
VSEFLNMGGYGAYVWPAYGLTFVVIAWNIIWARRLLARSREEARRRLEMRGEEA